MKFIRSILALGSISSFAIACSAQEPVAVDTLEEALTGDVIFKENWENGTNAWETTSVNFSNFGNGQGTALATTTDAATCSGKYLRETLPWAGGRFFTKNLITVKPGTTYCMQVLVRGKGNSNGFVGLNATASTRASGVEHWLIGGQPGFRTNYGVNDTVTPIAKDGKWHWAAKQFVPLAGETKIVIKGEQFQGTNAILPTDAAEFDDIRLVEGPCPAAAPLPDAISCGNSCDIPTNTCIACNGNEGSAASQPCQVKTKPICSLAGAGAGSCRGCKKDAECSNSAFCNTGTGACDPKVANGGAIPGSSLRPIANRDPSDPQLDGACTPRVGSAVCKAAICSVVDSLCGLRDGESGCTAANAATICRSGFCSQGGTCIGANACVTDGDCKDGWCDMSAGKCKAPVPNGDSIPVDSKHVTPRVAGVCQPDTATLVCLSKSCETVDNRCGLKNGTNCAADATCRSAVCFNDKKCGKPVGETCTGNGQCRSAVCNSGRCIGCASDSECSAGSYCDKPGTGDAACLPKKPNLDPCGAANECLTGTCDSNKKCGKLDGKVCASPTECQTPSCADGACGAATCESDADCGDSKSGRVCDTSATGGKCIDGCKVDPAADRGCPDTFVCSDVGTAFGACVAAGPADDGATLEGGGLGCAVTPAATRTSLGALLAAVGLVVATFRRRK